MILNKISKYELMPFQRAGIEFIKDRKYSLLADSMGLGKTIQGLWACRELDCKRLLIICPASIINQWAEKAKEFYPFTQIEIMDGRPIRSQHFKSFILIASYNRAGSDKGKRELHKLNYDMVIIDEMHFIKNPSAKRTVNILGGRQIKNGK